MECAYCRVPTAATIEHVQPRSEGGPSQTYNLVLACPYCNTRKSTRDANEFIASGDWRTVQPENLEASVEAMIRARFGWEKDLAYLPTGSKNARLRLGRGGDGAGDSARTADVLIDIRAGRRYPWQTTNLGKSNNRRVVRASYDFLFRHQTPSEPRYRPTPEKKPWED